MLIVACCIHYFARTALYSAEKQYLNDEVVIIQKLLNTYPGNLWAIHDEVQAVPIALKKASYHYFVKILTNHHEIITETRGVNALLDHAPFPVLQKHWQDNLRSWLYKNKHYLLISAPLSFKHHHDANIYIALDKTFQYNLLVRFRWLLLIFSIICIIVMSLLSIFVIKHSLQALDKVSNTATEIELNTLNKITDVDSWPNELKPVISAFNQMIDNLSHGFYKFKRSVMEMAHELKSPISNLVSENSVTLLQQRSVDEYQETIASNLEELRRVDQIVNDILFLAQSDAQKMELKREIFSANQEITMITDLFSAAMSEKNISVELRGDANVMMDKNLFGRLINNVLSNAIAYSHANTSINITIKKNSNTAEITIQDQGIGIAEDDIKHIFSNFYRTDIARCMNQKGNGLGLAIVYNIVKLHNAEVTINSQVGKGTLVIITNLSLSN